MYNRKYSKIWKGGVFKISSFDLTWFIAVFSITGSFFNIKKNVICFYFWCICEFFCFIIDVKNRQYGRAFLDAFCFCMNVYGIFTWTKGKRSKNKANKVDQDSFNTSSSMIERI